MTRPCAQLALLLSFLLATQAATPPAPPPLDLLASIWQPADPSVYGALSVTNAWGTLLLSSQNVLGVNGVEMAPFSSGWDSENLYGWPTDTASLFLDGQGVAPQSTLWTPYSGLRTAAAGGALITSEVRWVFEAQAILFEVNLTYPEGGLLNATVHFNLPLRYYPRADACDSLHYPTHSEPCCWNWFPPQPAHGQDTEAIFVPAWETCSAADATPAALTQQDVLSAAGSAFAFPGACSAPAPAAPPPPPPSVSCPIPSPSALNPGHLAAHRAASAALGASLTELGAPTATAGSTATWVRAVAPGETARLRFALAFSNATSAATNAAVARALAGAFPQAWADAAGDWQARFNAVFDVNRSHFSGFLPTLATGGGEGSGDWRGQGGFASPMERIYYSSIISLLANERTNFPPSLPSHPGACPVSPAVSAPFVRSSSSNSSAGAAACSSGSTLDRYIPHDLACAITGVGYSGGTRKGLRGGYRGGEGASTRLRAGSSPLQAASLLEEEDAPWRMFMTGGGLNSTTNIFLWDNHYGAQLLLLLEPETFARQLLLWMGSVDETGQPSYLAYWGYDYASRRGVGNYYSTNLFTLLELIHAYLRVTGDSAFLSTTLSIGPFPNGTFAQRTVYSLALDMAQYWRTQNPQGYLQDFGLAPNLLECVPSYIHYVAGPNAGNAWMAAAMSTIAGAWAGDAATAAALASDAAGIASAVLSQLYIPGEGYWRALQPNGTTNTVQHVMDYTLVTRFLGVQGGVSGGRVSPGLIPATQAGEMAAWVQANLLVPHWMRALALSDPAAPLSNRSDHGPYGSYIGWPALTIKALHSQGQTLTALSFLNDTLFSATLGPYGQAIQVRPPGDPYKPMDVTLYNVRPCVASAIALPLAPVAIPPTLTLPTPYSHSL